MDLKGILGDLLTLEVNTIIKDGMTAHKMPPLPFALHDIINEYADVISEFNVDLEPYFAEHEDSLWLRLGQLADSHAPGDSRETRAAAAHELIAEAEQAYSKAKRRDAKSPDERRDLFNYVTDLWPVLEQGKLAKPRKRFSMAKVGNGWDSFERLRIAAHEAIDHGELAPGDELLLQRIVGNCSRLKFIVQGLQREGPNRALWAELVPKTRNELLRSDIHGKCVPLDTVLPEHQAGIRKIWEVGTERILAQTCIAVDGDVISRISPTLLEQHSEAVRDMIMAAHRQSIDTGLSYWKLLVEVAERLVSGMFGKRKI